ncbi:Nudix hydrolase [Fusarium subglutinans]|uniref:Nudix hydrolase n=1 Tax=Gibberella subglutinans TaxID=42677 RepID=A0A8H5PW05_GIBSU|nr:Nudix hydrolase [Fusarium subglutinans]KAF5604555.1 Nudix hydrolase [Fusarium subglutinans]
MSQKTQEPVITKTSDLPVDEAKWITLKKIEYVDQVGKARTWEVATRKTRGKSGVDAVAMGNILLHPSKPASTLLVIQYRPPLDAYTIEWPAGLIDAEETAEEAAVREFKEETGYDCKVLSVSPAQAADPGMTNANMQLAMVEVQLGENDEEPEQRLDDGEHIQREIIPLSQLYERLVEYSKRERTVVAAKLFHFAAGMHFAQTQKPKRYGIQPSCSLANLTRKQRDSELVSNLEDELLALKDYVRKLEAACGHASLPNFAPSTLDDDVGTLTVPEMTSKALPSMTGETSFVGPSGSFCFPVSGHGIETQSTGPEAEESIQVLLDLFRQHINSVHHFVPPPVIETLKAPESLDSELLQASVLAAASLFADSQRQVYADRAEAIVMKCCRTIPSVVTIQALAILTWRELALENENNAWLYNSMAASLVVHLGLHVSSLENVMQIPIGPPSDIDKSVRVQTFWSVFLMDRNSTSMLGRNCMIPWRRVRATPYLKACSNPTTEDAIFDAHCQMWFIHDRYMDKIYSFEFGELEHFERHQLLSEARDHHMNFFRQIGRDLELRKNNMSPQVILLHMVYNMSLLLIHRPYLREPKDSAVHQLSVRTNMTSAHALVRLIRQYDKEANLENAPFFAVHCVLTAAVSLLLNVTYANSTIRGQSVHRFRVCVDALDKMKRWTRARRGLLLLRELANRWKVVSALPMRHSVPLVAPTQETPQTDDNDLDWGMLFANLEEPLSLDTIDLSTPTGEWVFHEGDESNLFVFPPGGS